MRSMSILCSHDITHDEFDQLMQRLTAVREDNRWRIERDNSVILVEHATDDMTDTFSEDELQRAALLIGASIQARIAVLYKGAAQGNEFRMGVAVARAVNDRWPSVIDDHAGQMYSVAPTKNVFPTSD